MSGLKLVYQDSQRPHETETEESHEDYKPGSSSLSIGPSSKGRLNSGRESLEGGLWNVEEVSGRVYGIRFDYC